MPIAVQEEELGNEEISYRRGYVHGVHAAIQTVDVRLSDKDRATLDVWKAELLRWRGFAEDSNKFEAPLSPDLSATDATRP